MAISGGWTGKTLWIDLSENRISTVPTSDFEPEKYIGGVGLSSRIFWELGCPKVDALSPQSPLLIFGGPLAGVPGPFNRGEVCGIAAQSHPQEMFSYSGFGGKFTMDLKMAGYDGLVILGKADGPSYLLIDDDSVRIKDAASVWGKDTFETQKILAKTHPGASVLTIGPAGENRCRFAIIINETSGAAGQGGYGAVMGSKNLKAVVVRGTGIQKIAKPEALRRLIADRMAAGEWLTGAVQSWGRSAPEPMASEMRRKYLKRFSGCHGCTFQCMGFHDVPGVGKGASMCVDAWYGFFSKGSIPSYWHGQLMAQKLGINNYELLGIMSFLLTTVPGGIVSKQDLGLTNIPQIDHAAEPEFGGAAVQHKFLTELLDGIAGGKSPLSQGTARFAERLGPAVSAAYDRVFAAHGYMAHHVSNVGSALHWATDTRDPFNSCHEYYSFGKSPKIAAHFGVPGGDTYPARKMVYDDAEKLTAWVQHNQSLKNSLVWCEYASRSEDFFHPPQMDIRIFMSKVLSAVTGIDYDTEALNEAGERIYAMRRAIMVLRENRTRDDDTIAPIYFKKKTENLSAPLDKNRFEALKDRFYALRGWDTKNGRPKRDKLEQLGMKQVADKLQGADKLG